MLPSSLAIFDVENEHFINWMNVETFSNFRKLWGKINIDLEEGNYYLLVHDRIKKYRNNKW